MNVKDKFAKLPPSAKLSIFASLLLIGVLLLIFGGRGGSGGSSDGLDSGEIEKYRKELESEISELCRGVRGAGEVRVAVSLSGGFEYVYATDKNGKIITSGDAGVIIKKKLPEIAGVGIVCSGGGDPAVKNQLISLVSAAYGIGTNRIFVAEAKKQS